MDENNTNSTNDRFMAIISSSQSTNDMISSTPISASKTSTRKSDKAMSFEDKSNANHWFPFIFILSVILLCLVGIDPQQDLHLESIGIN